MKQAVAFFLILSCSFYRTLSFSTRLQFSGHVDLSLHPVLRVTSHHDRRYLANSLGMRVPFLSASRTTLSLSLSFFLSPRLFTSLLCLFIFVPCIFLFCTCTLYIVFLRSSLILLRQIGFSRTFYPIEKLSVPLNRDWADCKEEKFTPSQASEEKANDLFHSYSICSSFCWDFCYLTHLLSFVSSFTFSLYLALVSSVSSVH